MGTLRAGVVGAAMGAAELVPGFSGGTVALVGGIYPRLIANVRRGAGMLAALARGRPRAALAELVAIEWAFVGTLLAGMALAIGTLAGTLVSTLQEHPVVASATFLGLVTGAAVAAWRQLRAATMVHASTALVAACVVFVALGVAPATSASPGGFALFAGAALAACAWILPGVSGAFLLLLLGLYPAALAAVEQRDVLLVAVIIAGVLTGLATFSTALHWLLERHHDLVLAAMTGVLLGSSRVLWPWPSATGMGDPTLGAPPSGGLAVPTACAVVAMVSVVVIDRLANRRPPAGGTR